MPKTHIIAVTLLASLLAAVSGLEASPSRTECEIRIFCP